MKEKIIKLVNLIEKASQVTDQNFPETAHDLVRLRDGFDSYIQELSKFYNKENGFPVADDLIKVFEEQFSFLGEKKLSSIKAQLEKVSALGWVSRNNPHQLSEDNLGALERQLNLNLSSPEFNAPITNSFMAINGCLYKITEEKVKQLTSICDSYKQDLETYKNEIAQKHQVEFSNENYEKSGALGAQKINTSSAIRIVEELEGELKRPGVSAQEKIDNFLKVINKEDDSGEKVNQRTLSHAHKGKSFLQKIKEFFGLSEKKVSTHSFFKSVNEAIRPPEEKEEMKQQIENFKFTRMR